ncbi:hypothetical protein ACLVWU_02325 [Bdellovibrio sp. HCB290]|uniref:hypothetical protein n=1 Tax=Bdellovibrio sp. HCB290 TaxID=3394356 RepID=UPI0039B3B55D
MKNMFWGILIVVIGLCFLADSIFGINIPVFRILCGVLLVYLGLQVILGSFGAQYKLNAEKRKTDHEAIFSESTFQYPNASLAKEYITLFGNSKLDLRSVEKVEDVNLESVTVFGNTEIIVKKGTPLRIQATTAFGKSELPGKNNLALGEYLYTTPGLKEGDVAMTFKTTSVFGAVKVTEAD